MNLDLSVEQLTYWIERATSEYDEGSPFHSWDQEYAQDTLDGFLPDLGKYVSLLKREHPMGSAEFYRRALVTLFNIFQNLKLDDDDLSKQINELFSKVLEYKGV